MQLMRNKYFIFENIEFLDKVVKNISTLNLLPDIPEKYFSSNYIKEMKVSDGVLLEALSFELYESTDYWDILLVLNDMRSMNELPVKYDIVITRADKALEDWRNEGKCFPGIYNNELIDSKYKEILDYEIEKNEKYRYIKYISHDHLSELIAELDLIASKPKINENIII